VQRCAATGYGTNYGGEFRTSRLLIMTKSKRDTRNINSVYK
jgi:hypothetical protein